jgi:hypothetical protein
VTIGKEEYFTYKSGVIELKSGVTKEWERINELKEGKAKRKA